MPAYAREELKQDSAFKSVRANTGVIGKAAAFNQPIKEEARAGWVLVEKFDNTRVQFNRSRGAHLKDAQLPPALDPYRPPYGLSQGAFAVAIRSVTFGALGLVLAIVFVIERFAR